MNDSVSGLAINIPWPIDNVRKIAIFCHSSLYYPVYTGQVYRDNDRDTNYPDSDRDTWLRLHVKLRDFIRIGLHTLGSVIL